MSNAFVLYAYNEAISEADKRRVAVRAALQLINTRVSSNQVHENLTLLLEQLSTYADQIQKALEVK